MCVYLEFFASEVWATDLLDILWWIFIAIGDLYMYDHQRSG